jgi:hypothetical protein
MSARRPERSLDVCRLSGSNDAYCRRLLIFRQEIRRAILGGNFSKTFLSSFFSAGSPINELS